MARAIRRGNGRGARALVAAALVVMGSVSGCTPAHHGEAEPDGTSAPRPVYPYPAMITDALAGIDPDVASYGFVDTTPEQLGPCGWTGDVPSANRISRRYAPVTDINGPGDRGLMRYLSNRMSAFATAGEAKAYLKDLTKHLSCAEMPYLRDGNDTLIATVARASDPAHPDRVVLVVHFPRQGDNVGSLQVVEVSLFNTMIGISVADAIDGSQPAVAAALDAVQAQSDIVHATMVVLDGKL